MRRYHKKTRIGCAQCKTRRVKCDEKKPTCSGCLRQKLKCSFQFLTPAIPGSRPSQSPAWAQTASGLTTDLVLSLDSRMLELLDHYHKLTSYTIGREGKMGLWLVAIPQLAISYEFLMHGLLALSALHLSTLQPARKSELVKVATMAESKALPLFRDVMRRNEQQNISAVFAFAGFVIPYVAAQNTWLDIPVPEIPCRDEPHWMLLARGLINMMEVNWSALEQGPFGPLMGRTATPHEKSWNPDDGQYAKMYGMLKREGETNEEEKTDLLVLEGALDELRRAACLPYAPAMVVTVQSAVYFWPGTVSQEYIELVFNRRPEALVILAHYCVLLKQIHWIWYLKDVGLNLLSAIERELDDEWKPWIQWAIDQPIKRWL